MKIELREYQSDAIEQARQAIRDGATNVLICAPTGGGKCLGRGTPVLMFDGTIKPVDDVAVGDTLMGPDSKPRAVLSTTVGYGPLYRVKPKKGDPYVVNDAHILSLKMTSGATKWDCSRSDTYAAGKLHNITVTDYLSRSATFRHCAKGWRTGVHWPARERATVLPPYFIGAWLGDGLSRGPAVCTADSEVAFEVEQVAAQFGLRVRIEEQAGNKARTVHITSAQRGGQPSNFVREELARLGLLQNKHIPHGLLTASREDRLELLAGLIDTDGAASRGGFDFVQKNERLAREVAFLARSLGLAAYVTPTRKVCTNNGVAGDYWRISISGECSAVPVRIACKRPTERTINKDALLVGLSVEPIGEGDYFGFEIDGDHLFLLGDFTVTHNTVIAAALIEANQAKGRRSAFVVDRVSLISQTSETFDRYGIDHGIVQASHWRFKPSKPVQICSVQTVARRQWPQADLIVVDEAHTVTETVKKRIEPRDTITVGLTATPFTKGLGKLYDAIVNVTTTNRLIEQGFLSKYRIFSCAEPDMTGVSVTKLGEWDSGETEQRALQVVGDVVQEYIKHGQGRKFICSAVDTAHVEELHRQFLAAGINCATYTYKDRDEDRADTLVEYRKPDSTIRGLITVTAASKGFDVADIGVVIMARPLRKSLAEHIQFFGRGLRIAPGKEECTVLDHSGNCGRFWADMQEFFEHGVGELDDGKKKEKKKPEKNEADAVKCPSCRALHKPMPFCPVCGHAYPRKAAVEHVPGSLKELIATGDAGLMRRKLWPQVVSYVLESTDDMERAQRKAQAIFRELTGDFARARVESTTPQSCSQEVRNKIRANQIRWARSRARSAEAVAT